MIAYLIRRLLLVVPTLFGIMLVNFMVIQVVPGGPVEQMIAQMSGHAMSAPARFSGAGSSEATQTNTGRRPGIPIPMLRNLPRTPSRKIPLAEVKSDILNHLLKMETLKLKRGYITKLRQKAKIKNFL